MISVIEDNLYKLTKKELSIAKQIKKFPEIVIDKNITQLSDALGVSRNTITRFCKKLGFNGYSEFKFEIQRQSKINLDIDESFASYINQHEQNLNILKEQIENNEIIVDKLVKCINKNNSIKLCANGYSSLISSHLNKGLQKLNKYSDVIPVTYEIKDYDYLFNSKDLVIIISVSGTSFFSKSLLEAATRKNATIFLLTSNNISEHYILENLILLPNLEYNNPYTLNNLDIFFLFNNYLLSKLGNIIKIDNID